MITCARLSSLMSLNFEANTMLDKRTSLSFLGAFLPKITCYIFCVAGFISFFPLTYETFSFAIRQSNLFDVSKIQIYLFMFCEIAAPKRFPLIQTCLLLFHFLFSCYSFMHVIKVCLPELGTANLNSIPQPQIPQNCKRCSATANPQVCDRFAVTFRTSATANAHSTSANLDRNIYCYFVFVMTFFTFEDQILPSTRR